MPGYVPHTLEDQRAMLDRVGLSELNDLFAPIPEAIRLARLLDLPAGLPEADALRLLSETAAGNLAPSACFCGAGIYRHFTPSVVPAILQRGEFLTAYTPYQPERSQGLLQTIYEFQTLTCQLMGLDAANASMYDGSTALAEAVLMAASITGRKRVLLPETLHPAWREVCATYLQGHSVTLDTVPAEGGRTSVDALRGALGDDVAAVVVPQPNMFGLVEDAQALAAAAKQAGALVVAAVNPTAMALLQPPGEWPADIAVAEGQALGLPMSFGGPLVGLFACRREFVRQMPGRIVGATTDLDGRRAYTLTLQTREQHIRREKASSNICTNEALAALGVTVYLSLLGKTGLRRVATVSVQRAHEAFDAVTALPGYEPAFEGPFFHEFAVRCPVPVADINRALAEQGIVGPYDLSAAYPALGSAALFCCTEMVRREDVTRLCDILRSLA